MTSHEGRPQSSGCWWSVSASGWMHSVHVLRAGVGKPFLHKDNFSVQKAMSSTAVLAAPKLTSHDRPVLLYCNLSLASCPKELTPAAKHI